MPPVAGMLAFVAIAGCACASSALAQVPGAPVWRPLAPPGAVVEGLVAWPSDAAGGGHIWGAAVGYGEGDIALRGTIARVDTDAADAQLGWAALGRVAVLDQLASPFRAGAFVGIGGVPVRSGAVSATSFHVPVGADFGVVIPTPVGIFDGWVAPRLDLATANPLASSHLDARVAFAAGLDFVLLNGLGVRAAYDHVFRDESDRSTFGLGLLFRFKPGY